VATTSHPGDRLGVAVDDWHVVANSGLVLPATLGHRLGLGKRIEGHLDLGPPQVGPMWETRGDLGPLSAGGWRQHRRRPCSPFRRQPGGVVARGSAGINRHGEGDESAI